MTMDAHGFVATPVILCLAGLVLWTTPAAADLDVVFALDTTGSMGGELREVQQRVRQLALDLAAAREGERLRWGIVAYRDRGDDYVTRTFDLSEDVGAAEAFLSSLRAGGGGDGPESVVAAVAAALHEMSWNLSDDVERRVFLIGDAPPHLDYPDDPRPEDLVESARRSKIVVNTIGCRSLPPRGIDFFRMLAYATEGSYQHIGRVASSRPGELTDALGRTVMAGAEADGRELGVSWIDHLDGDATGILVRQGGPEGVAQSRSADGLAACTLEVRLPPDFALEHPPRVWLGRTGLRVELALTDGPGGIEHFTLTECPPTTTPVQVRIGGAT